VKTIAMLKTADRSLTGGKQVVRLQEGREYAAEAEVAHELVTEGLAVYAGEPVQPKAKSKPANKAIRAAENKDES